MNEALKKVRKPVPPPNKVQKDKSKYIRQPKHRSKVDEA